jgi:hypothetical protein
LPQALPDTLPIWIRATSGYPPHLDTRHIWIRAPSGYAPHLDTRHIWIPSPSGYAPHLDTRHIWMRATSGCAPHLDTRHIWMHSPSDSFLRRTGVIESSFPPRKGSRGTSPASQPAGHAPRARHAGDGTARPRVRPGFLIPCIFLSACQSLYRPLSPGFCPHPCPWPLAGTLARGIGPGDCPLPLTATLPCPGHWTGPVSSFPRHPRTSKTRGSGGRRPQTLTKPWAQAPPSSAA